MQGVRVQSLVKELRSHMPCSQNTQNKKQKQYCHKFNKRLFKMVYIKKKIFKTKKETGIEAIIESRGKCRLGRFMELKRRVNLTRDQPTKEITQIPIYSKSRNSLKGSPIQSPEGTFQRERSSPRSPQNIPHSWVLSVMMNQLDSCKLLPASFTMAQTCLCTQELNLSRSWETTQSKQTYKT